MRMIFIFIYQQHTNRKDAVEVICATKLVKKNCQCIGIFLREGEKEDTLLQQNI